MSRIRGKNTGIEIMLRKALHARGFRYRLHRRDLPGSPDLVFPSRQALIFVHGCFWHGHGCHLFRYPSANAGFWRSKIETNAARDRRNLETLLGSGWRVLTVWECALRGKGHLKSDVVVAECEQWLYSSEPSCELASCRQVSGK